MRPTPLANRLRTLAARLALGLLVFGFVGARAGAIEAAEVASAGPAAHGCKCGEACRGDSCCCSHGTTRARVKADDGPPPVPGAAAIAAARPRPTPPGRSPSSPCVQAAPCGDAGTPVNPSTEPIGRAALAGFVGIAAPMPVHWVGPETKDEAPAGRAGRLDEPPAAGGVA